MSAFNSGAIRGRIELDKRPAVKSMRDVQDEARNFKKGMERELGEMKVEPKGLAGLAKRLRAEQRASGEAALGRALANPQGLAGFALDAVGLGAAGLAAEFAGRAAVGATGAMLKWKRGSATGSDMAMEIMESLPILGNFATATKNVLEMWTGIRHQTAEMRRELAQVNWSLQAGNAGLQSKAWGDTELLPALRWAAQAEFEKSQMETQALEDKLRAQGLLTPENQAKIAEQRRLQAVVYGNAMARAPETAWAGRRQVSLGLLGGAAGMLGEFGKAGGDSWALQKEQMALGVQQWALGLMAQARGVMSSPASSAAQKQAAQKLMQAARGAADFLTGDKQLEARRPWVPLQLAGAESFGSSGFGGAAMAALEADRGAEAARRTATQEKANEILGEIRDLLGQALRETGGAGEPIFGGGT